MIYTCPQGHVRVDWKLPGEPTARCALCGSALVSLRDLLRVVR